MPIFDNFHGVCHMFSYLSTPRSLYDSKHNNASSLATACGDKPAHRCYGHVRVVAHTVSRADVTHRRTDRKFMDLPIPSPKHIIPNHPFYFFSFGKKRVGGKKVFFQCFFCCGVVFYLFIVAMRWKFWTNLDNYCTEISHYVEGFYLFFWWGRDYLLLYN